MTTASIRQWKITAEGGRAVAAPVREFTVGSIAEGCAADDETGALYVNEENVAHLAVFGQAGRRRRAARN